MLKVPCLLLVDDDIITTFIHQSLLRKLNICERIETAVNGEEALKKLSGIHDLDSNCPKLIFLDINMPVMDGFQFMEAFNELNFSKKDQITIVVLTTSLNENDVQRMGKLGVKYYLQKPLKDTQIIKLMADLI